MKENLLAILQKSLLAPENAHICCIKNVMNDAQMTELGSRTNKQAQPKFFSPPGTIVLIT